MKVGITHGDLNGVNYEILLKIFDDPRIAEICIPVVYGSPRVAAWYRKTLDLPPVQFNIIEDAAEARSGMVNMVNILGSEEPDVTPGLSSLQAGEAARIALTTAVADLKYGKIDVLVTAPINKNNIQSEEFNFPGHTEYLEKELGEDDDKALMILCSERLKVALVTTHIPVAEVASKITEELVLEKIYAFKNSLENDFGIPDPRIAVLALNPHAGDGGLLGQEEIRFIVPAIKEAREKGVTVFGPFPADGFFGSGNYARFDGVLAMYHDQGLIPFKLLSMDDGVNFTAGLKYVRTSPDHGTGYDIAGKNISSPDSLRAAVYAAMDIYNTRALEKDIKANPLEKHYVTTPRPRD